MHERSIHQGQLLNWLANSPINDPMIAGQGSTLLLGSLTCAPRGAEPRRLLLAALEQYIDQHVSPLQEAGLARLAGFSVAFLAEIGRTPMEHGRQRRLQLAEYLLRSSELQPLNGARLA